MGRLEEAGQAFHELAPLARRLGHTIYPESDELTLMTLLQAGDIDAYDAFNQSQLERARVARRLREPRVGYAVAGVVHFWRGRWREALADFEEAMKGEPPGTLYGMGAAYTMLASAYTGDREAALAVLRQKGSGVSSESSGSASLLRPMIRAARNSGLGYRGLLGLMLESRSMRTRGLLPRPGRPNTRWLVDGAFCAVEALAVLGEKAEAAKLYPMVLEGMKSGNLFRGFDMRLLDTVAGIAAGAGGNWTQGGGALPDGPPPLRRTPARRLSSRRRAVGTPGCSSNATPPATGIRLASS